MIELLKESLELSYQHDVEAAYRAFSNALLQADDSEQKVIIAERRFKRALEFAQMTYQRAKAVAEV